MTMNIDGSDQQQLTSLAMMSWAPYYHPSGRYLIFATNKHGFANFELYPVDVDGKHPPVRVTHTTGFDGLPVFTPNGKQLSWTTNRTANPNREKKSQIFIANWNHSAALKALALTAKTPEATDDFEHTIGRDPSRRTSYGAADAVRHVEYLCRPQL